MNVVVRNRNAFPMTDMLLKPIAVTAIIELISGPNGSVMSRLFG